MTKSVREVKGLILFWIGVVLCSIAGFDEFTSRQLIAKNQTLPSVRGRVTEKQPVGYRRGPTVTYEYVVNGTTYKSTHVRATILGNSCSDEDYAKHNEGQPVRVHYEPNHPENAYLIPAYDDRMRGYYLIGGLLILLGWLLRRDPWWFPL